MQERVVIYQDPLPPEYYLEDPRKKWDPTAKEDSHIWEEVLRIASEVCDETLYLLHFFRLSGAKLKVFKNSLMLVPVFSDDVNVSDWPNREKWDEERQKWLMPKKDVIIIIFEQAFQSLRQKKMV